MKKTKLYSEIGKLDTPHILYLVILKNNTEAFCKIGVTSKTIEERMSWIEGYDFTLIKSINGSGILIRGIESILKEQILDYTKHYQPKLKMGGYTECYELNYLKDIEYAFKFINKKNYKLESNNSNILIEKIKESNKRIKVLEKINEKINYKSIDKELELSLENKILEAKNKLLNFKIKLLEDDGSEIIM